jgi:hypothetical protein
MQASLLVANLETQLVKLSYAEAQIVAIFSQKVQFYDKITILNFS